MKKILLFCFFALSVITLSAQGNIGIVGTAANGWPDAATDPTPDIMLTNNGDGTHFIAALTLSTGEAKFRTDMDWANPNFGADAFPIGNINPNDNIQVIAGVYDILVDLNNNVITFTDVATFTDIELVGTGLVSGGTPQLSTTDGENYQLTTTQLTAGTLEFREVGTSTTYAAADFPSGNATQGGAAIVSQNGYYDINFNLTSGDYSFVIPTVGLVGPGTGNNWPDGSNPTPDIVMATTDGDTYTLDGQTLLDDLIKFRQNLAWNVSWGGATFPGDAAVPGGSDITAVAGTYDIVFSRSNLTYAFNVTASVNEESFANFKVYPNPSNNVWVFENQNEAIAVINVFDQTGKLILETAPQSFTGEIDAAVFTSGFYLAQIQLENGSQRTVKLFRK